MNTLVKYVCLPVLIFLQACATSSPEPIHYGSDACAHCKMTIMDDKFGTELVTSKGKVFKFDSIECMLDFIKDAPSVYLDAGNQVFLTDMLQPGSFIDARQAIYVHDETLQSPMGGNLAAFRTRLLAQRSRTGAGVKFYTWDELLRQF